MKRKIKSIFALIIKKIFTYLLTKKRLGRLLCIIATEHIWQQISRVKVEGKDLLFHRINDITAYRIDSFYEKEPETIDWLNHIPEGAIFWDIGANIGLYSIYAAKVRKARVYAFEPSVFNLELLVRNIYINNCSPMITAIPISLSDVKKESFFELTSIERGEACSTFDAGYDQHGKKLDSVFKYQTISITGDELLKLYLLEIPNYIKIDVDGIEHLVLAGMKNILYHNNIQSIIVETSFDFDEHEQQINMILTDAGYTLDKKEHAKIFDVGEYKHTYNCIWVRR